MRKALGLVLALGVATQAFADDAPQPPPAAPAPAPAEPPPGTGSGGPPGQTMVDPALSATPVGPEQGMPAQPTRDIVVKYRPDRTKDARVMIGVLGGAALAFGAVGVYFHLDSRDVSDELTTHKFTAKTWTPELQDTYDRGHDAKAIATISYGIAGACLIATVVALIVTEPAQQEMRIHPHLGGAESTIVAPIPGGAFVSQGWSF